MARRFANCRKIRTSARPDRGLHFEMTLPSLRNKSAPAPAKGPRYRRKSAQNRIAETQVVARNRLEVALTADNFADPEHARRGRI
jgi:hypothetical protein